MTNQSIVQNFYPSLISNISVTIQGLTQHRIIDDVFFQPKVKEANFVIFCYNHNCIR